MKKNIDKLEDIKIKNNIVYSLNQIICSFIPSLTQ